jgi:DNA-binding XRE family transcriptional regulator
VPFCRDVLPRLKSLRKKNYSEQPQTLGEHIKKRRRELGLLQREAAERMGVSAETVANWESGKTKPVATQLQPVVGFLGYDSMPKPETLADRLEAKRRALSVTLDQVAKLLRVGPRNPGPVSQRHLAYFVGPAGQIGGVPNGRRWGFCRPALTEAPPLSCRGPLPKKSGYNGEVKGLKDFKPEDRLVAFEQLKRRTQRDADKGSTCQKGDMCFAPLTERLRSQRRHRSIAPERPQMGFEL